MYYGGLSGFVSGIGDPYTVFLDPEITAEFSENISGKFEGIGAEVGIKNERLTIIAPMAGSPAEKAGLLSGDQVFGIDTTALSL